MKPRLLAVACVASSIALLAACGGAKESDLFGPPSATDVGTDTNGTDPGDPSPSAPETGSSGATSSSSGATSSTSSSGGSSGGSTSSSGGSSSSSGGSTSSSGGTSSSSSGGTTTPKGVWCGEDEDGDSVYCGSGAACCAKSNGGAPSLECTSSGWGCQGGLTIRCDDQSDCSFGQVCCGMFDQNFGYKSVQCQPSCNSVSGSILAVRFCDHEAAVDECQAIGKTCQWSGSLPGYSVCK